MPMTMSAVIPEETNVSAGPYVLLIDDHESCLKQLSELVRFAGHRCVSFTSPAGALRYCDARRPQVVVTDLAMPNLDGIALARWLKERYPSLPMILVTGENLEPTLRECLRQTFTAVFTKPLDIDRFLDRLERLMPPWSPARGPGRA